VCDEVVVEPSFKARSVTVTESPIHRGKKERRNVKTASLPQMNKAIVS